MGGSPSILGAPSAPEQWPPPTGPVEVLGALKRCPRRAAIRGRWVLGEHRERAEAGGTETVSNTDPGASLSRDSAGNAPVVPDRLQFLSAPSVRGTSWGHWRSPAGSGGGTRCGPSGWSPSESSLRPEMGWAPVTGLRREGVSAARENGQVPPSGPHFRRKIGTLWTGSLTRISFPDFVS